MIKAHYELLYHFIWHTKDDRPFIDEEVEGFLFPCIGQKCKQEGYKLIAINGVENHIHVLISLRPTQPIWEVVKMLKGASSHDVNLHFQNRKTLYWQNGYGAFTVSSHDLDMIKKYIDEQKVHHRKGTAVTNLEKHESD